jgi:tetratricopeptide (TPR) repeat protein
MKRFVSLLSYKKATDICDKTIKLYPKDAKVYYYRALILKSADYYNNNDKAIKDLTYAIKLEPTYFEAYYKRALIIKEQDSCGYNEKIGCHKAIKDLTSAIKYNSNFTEAYVKRADIYGVLGDYSKKLKTIKTSPNNAKLYLEKADAYFMLRDYEKQRYDIKRACELGECKEYERYKWMGLEE